MARVYEQVYEGDWNIWHRREVVECCDCCLVHNFRFRIRKGKLEVQIFRNNRSTAQRRKAAGIKIVKKREPKRKR